MSLQRRQPRRRRGQLEGDALSAEAADAQQDAAKDGEQEVRSRLVKCLPFFHQLPIETVYIIEIVVASIWTENLMMENFSPFLAAGRRRL